LRLRVSKLRGGNWYGRSDHDLYSRLLGRGRIYIVGPKIAVQDPKLIRMDQRLKAGLFSLHPAAPDVAAER